MGLDTTHDCWHGAYSAFTRWRDILAEAAGFSFTETTGFPGKQIDVDWGQWPADAYLDPPFIPCRLDGKPDPVLLLIMHSDCEGKIRHEFLAPLADRLTELLPALENIDGGGHVGNAADKTRTFIAGLRRAIEAGEDVEFW